MREAFTFGGPRWGLAGGATAIAVLLNVQNATWPNAAPDGSVLAYLEIGAILGFGGDGGPIRHALAHQDLRPGHLDPRGRRLGLVPAGVSDHCEPSEQGFQSELRRCL